MWVGGWVPNLPLQVQVIWTAGASNILEPDGVTLHYKAYGDMGVRFFSAHKPCIDALVATGSKVCVSRVCVCVTRMCVCLWVCVCVCLHHEGLCVSLCVCVRLTSPPHQTQYVIWCPGYMKSVGAKSAVKPAISTRALPGGNDFVSYEDAAAVMLDAAEVTTFDNEHITANTPAPAAAAKHEL